MLALAPSNDHCVAAVDACSVTVTATTGTHASRHVRDLCTPTWAWIGPFCGNGSKNPPLLGQFLVICVPKVRVPLRTDAFGGHKPPRAGTAATNTHILGYTVTLTPTPSQIAVNTKLCGISTCEYSARCA